VIELKEATYERDESEESVEPTMMEAYASECIVTSVNWYRSAYGLLPG
jgi:hypothetical protein